MDRVAIEARRPETLHARANSYVGAINPNRSGYTVNLRGLRGEQAFAEAFGLPMDFSARPAGDAGIDFRIGLSNPNRAPT